MREIRFVNQEGGKRGSECLFKAWVMIIVCVRHKFGLKDSQTTSNLRFILQNNLKFEYVK